MRKSGDFLTRGRNLWAIRLHSLYAVSRKQLSLVRTLLARMLRRKIKGRGAKHVNHCGYVYMCNCLKGSGTKNVISG